MVVEQFAADCDCYSKGMSPKGGESMTDEQILALFEKRDEQALHAVSAQYRTAALRTAKKYLRTDEDAEECVSDVLMQLWQEIPPAKPQNFEAFIVTLTKRTALDLVRRQQAVKRGGGQTAASLEAVGDTLPAAESVEDTISRKLLTEAVEHFLDSLSADARTIFTERWHNDAPPREIARKFGISGAHVRKSLMQTRRKLKQYLEKEGLL